MATKKKAAAKVTPKAPAKRTPAKPAVKDLDAVIDAGKRDAQMNVQSGMDPGPASDDRARAVRDRFATADELAAPTAKQRAALEEHRVQLQVRGY